MYNVILVVTTHLVFLGFNLTYILVNFATLMMNIHKACLFYARDQFACSIGLF